MERVFLPGQHKTRPDSEDIVNIRFGQKWAKLDQVVVSRGKTPHTIPLEK